MTQSGMILPSMKNVTALPVAHWVDRVILMRAVRRSMTIGQYMAYCQSTTPIR